MILALTLLVLGAGTDTDASLVEKGKQVYAGTSPKCGVCHAIGGQGNPKSKLDGVGGRLTAEEIKAWVRTPREMAEKKGSTLKPAMLPYSQQKLTDEDLEALSAYLRSLK